MTSSSEADPEEPAKAADEISVFPNPATGAFTIRVAKPSLVNISDLRGGTVMEENISESLTINHLVPGFYFVRIRNCDKQMVTKLVIK
jgi:hypothetical protein